MFGTQTVLNIFLINIIADVSSAAIATVSVHKIYLRVIPLTIDATPLNNNKLFNDRTGNNSLNLTFIIKQETFNETRTLTQQDIQTPSHFN